MIVRVSKDKYPRGDYEKFPAFPAADCSVSEGYGLLAENISERIGAGLRVLAVDGFNGVDWVRFRTKLDESLSGSGIDVGWVFVEKAFHETSEIEKRIAPFLGGDDPIFGMNFPFGAEVFFDPVKFAEFRNEASVLRGSGSGKLTVFYGCGAALLEQRDELWYLDRPKDYIQLDAREGLVRNLGASEVSSFGDFYKRSYFVDWPAMNRLKQRVLPEISLFIDIQDKENPIFISGPEFRDVLYQVSGSPFRVRPWFYPGPWGGKFMQGHMGLDPDQPNFAWSFELIVPENGIIIENGGKRLEFSFDWLMFQENERVLGTEAAAQFKYEWPVRFDYLDTVEGGNLSTQVHPRPDFIRREFGETYTQDETYYIVKSEPGSRVYLGLTESCDPEEFRAVLEESSKTGKEVDIDKYVNSEPSKTHDLFLIPNGTVHCSGSGNVVLEISATPYIFTFKIYDYLRKDLEGNFRPINVERAFKNIYPHRKTSWVRDNLIAEPRLVNEGGGWKDYILYDSPLTFYNIHRIEFEESVEYESLGRAFTINLVEGDSIELETAGGCRTGLAWLETMLVPAATEKIIFRNRGKGLCRLVLVYVRPGIGRNIPLNAPGESAGE